MFSDSASIRTMEVTLAPVSIAVELATLVMRDSRYFADAFRYGFVLINGLLGMFFIITQSSKVISKKL